MDADFGHAAPQPQGYLTSHQRKPLVHHTKQQEPKQDPATEQGEETKEIVLAQNAAPREQHQAAYCRIDGDSWMPEKDKEQSIRGEQALWRAVITQALMDANSNSAKSEMQYEKRQAAAWLRGGGRDFYTVCHCADLDPAYVRERARRVLEKGTAEKAAEVMAPETETEFA